MAKHSLSILYLLLLVIPIEYANSQKTCKGEEILAATKRGGQNYQIVQGDREAVFTPRRNDEVDSQGKTVIQGGFIDSRPLLREGEHQKGNQWITSYQTHLGDGFIEALAALSKGGRWLDIGMSPKAVEEYLKSNKFKHKAEVTGVSVNDSSDEATLERLRKMGVRMMTGRYIQEIPNSELGLYDVISDVTSTSYDWDPHIIQYKIGRLLTENGLYFTNMRAHAIQIFRGLRRSGNIFDDWLFPMRGLELYRPDSSYQYGVEAFDGRAEIPLVFQRTKGRLIIRALDCFDRDSRTPPIRYCRLVTK